MNAHGKHRAILTEDITSVIAGLIDLGLDTGPLDKGWHLFSRFDRKAVLDLQRALHLQAEAFPGLDERGQAAFLLGAFSYRLAAALVLPHLKDGRLPQLGTDQAGWRLDFDDEGQPHLRLRLSETIVIRELGAANRVRGIGAELPVLLAPLVARFLELTSLSRAAQWRLVADSIAAAFLHFGTELGDERRAMDDAMRIVGPNRSRLGNKQVGFFTIEMQGEPGGRTHHFLKRGGCCRYYTAVQGNLCPTCVLRGENDQVEALTDYVEAMESSGNSPTGG